MPKITIDLDSNTHQILKELAKKEKRSLTNYIIVTLDKYVSTLDKSVNDEKNLSFPETSEEKTVTTTKPVKKSIVGDEEDKFSKWTT